MNDIRAAAVQAREADYLARLNFLRRLSPEDLLEELLAVIHGDGGNYSDAHGLAKAVADAEVKYHAIAAAPAPQPLSEEQKREIILRIIGKDDPVSAITAYRIIHETLHMLSPSPQQDGPSEKCGVCGEGVLSLRFSGRSFFYECSHCHGELVDQTLSECNVLLARAQQDGPSAFRDAVLEEAAKKAESDEFYGTVIPVAIAAAIRGMKGQP